jgi:hypothetical protein
MYRDEVMCAFHPVTVTLERFREDALLAEALREPHTSKNGVIGALRQGIKVEVDDRHRTNLIRRHRYILSFSNDVLKAAQL